MQDLAIERDTSTPAKFCKSMNTHGNVPQEPLITSLLEYSVFDSLHAHLTCAKYVGGCFDKFYGNPRARAARAPCMVPFKSYLELDLLSFART